MAGATFLGSVYANLELKTDQFTKQVQGAEKDMQKMESGISDSLGRISQSFTRGGAILTAGLTVPLSILGGSMLKVAGDMEQNRVSFSTMLGSAEAAGKALGEISDFAAKTPFTLPQVVEGSKQLLAYGFTQDDVLNQMRMLGDVAAGLNIPLGDLVYVYGTLRAQGRAYQQDIRQFTMRGVPMIEELSKVMGVTQEEVKGLVEEGKIGFPEVQKALENMTNSGGKFGGLMENQSKTFQGIMSNIQDNLIRTAYAFIGISTDAETFGQVVEGGVFDKLRQGAQKVLDGLQKFTDWFQTLSTPIKNAAIYFGVFLAALGPILVILGSLAGAVNALIAFFSAGGLGGVLAGFVSGPIGWVIGGIIALIAIFTLLWKKSEEFRNMVIKIKDTFMSILSPIIEFIRQQFEQLKAKLMELWEVIGPYVITALKWLGIILGGIVVGAIMLVVLAITGLVAGITWLVNHIIDAAKWIWNKVSFIYEVFKLFFQLSWDLIVSIFTAIKDFFVGIWTSIWEFIQPFVYGIYELFRFTFWATYLIIETVFNTIKNFFISVWTAIWEFIEPTLTKIWNFISIVSYGIRDVVVGAFSYAKDSIMTIVRWLADNIGKPLSDAWNKFKEFDQKVRDIIGGLIKGAWDWGVNLIQGFIDGVKSMFTNLGDVFKGAADKIKAFLGFSSPTKEGPGRFADQWIPNLFNMLNTQVKALAPILGQTIAQGLSQGQLQTSGGVKGDINSTYQFFGPVNMQDERTLDALTAKIGEKLLGDFYPAKSGGI